MGRLNGKILVTGAAGQLGRSFARVADEYPGLGFLLPDERYADITNPGLMERLIHGDTVSAVINCAAYTAVDRAEEDETAAARVNTEGPAVLARICAREGVPLVHYSTDYIFDGRAGKPYPEDAEPAPLNVYGRTKLDGEKAVAASGCTALVIRTSWVYSGFGNNFVATMLRLAREGRPIQVVDDQYGTPAYATDIARATIFMLLRGVEGFDILNYNALGTTTWYGFAREIFRLAGVGADVIPVSTDSYPVKARRPAYGVLDISKARNFGVPIRHWQEALAECLREMGIICGDQISGKQRP